MRQKVNAIYENGVLQPLEPLNLPEHERVSITVESANDDDWLDHDAIEWAKREGDPTISLEEVRKALSSISGSMAETIIEERGEF
jgi:predicted DNA-binding antitoxin AbrB/MazE fold protein